MLFFISGLLGELFVVGDNKNGNLGINRSNSTISTFTKIPNIEPVQVAAGAEMTAVLSSDGKVYTAGHNVKGSLCVSAEKVEYQDSFTPVPDLQAGEVVQIAATSKSLLLLLQNWSVLACGSNEDGRLSYFNKCDEEEHVLSEMDIPAGTSVKQIVGMHGQNLLVTQSEIFLTGPVGDLASVI